MKIDKSKVLISSEDLEYLLKFEKYIRHFKAEIYEDAYSWALDKNNLSGYPDNTLPK